MYKYKLILTYFSGFIFKIFSNINSEISDPNTFLVAYSIDFTNDVKVQKPTRLNCHLFCYDKQRCARCLKDCWKVFHVLSTLHNKTLNDYYFLRLLNFTIPRSKQLAFRQVPASMPSLSGGWLNDAVFLRWNSNEGRDDWLAWCLCGLQKNEFRVVN